MSSEGSDEIYRAGLKSYRLSAIKSVFHRKTLTFAATSMAFAIFAASARGEIFLFVVMLWKNWEKFQFLPLHNILSSTDEKGPSNNHTEPEVRPPSPNNYSESPLSPLDELLRPYHLQHFYIHVPAGLASSFLFFFLIGGYLQW